LKIASCRDALRREVARAFARERRFMGEFSIRVQAELAWIPLEVYREGLHEMVGRHEGPAHLIAMAAAGSGHGVAHLFRVYFPVAMAYPRAAGPDISFAPPDESGEGRS
jgi:hypothetical protein